jgi:hypothetical protein
MYIILFRLELLSLHIEILDVVSIPIQYLQLIIGTSNLYLLILGNEVWQFQIEFLRISIVEEKVCKVHLVLCICV